MLPAVTLASMENAARTPAAEGLFSTGTPVPDYHSRLVMARDGANDDTDGEEKRPDAFGETKQATQDALRRYKEEVQSRAQNGKGK